MYRYRHRFGDVFSAHRLRVEIAGNFVRLEMNTGQTCSYETLAGLDIMGAQFRAPLKTLYRIVL